MRRVDVRNGALGSRSDGPLRLGEISWRGGAEAISRLDQWPPAPALSPPLPYPLPLLRLRLRPPPRPPPPRPARGNNRRLLQFSSPAVKPQRKRVLAPCFLPSPPPSLPPPPLVSASSETATSPPLLFLVLAAASRCRPPPPPPLLPFHLPRSLRLVILVSGTGVAR